MRYNSESGIRLISNQKNLIETRKYKKKVVPAASAPEQNGAAHRIYGDS